MYDYCSALHLPRYFILALTLSVLANPCLAEVSGTAAANQPERLRAGELFKAGKCIDALPIYEKLVVDQPNNLAIKEELAWCLFQQAHTLSDATQRKLVQTRARGIALEAHQKGDNSQLMQAMLDMQVDGELPTYSSRNDINELMRAAEADFARGDLDQALAGYARVLQRDPKNYEAHLYTGDVYYKKQSYEDAGTWFGRAIQINPHRETAHRYWGDVLLAAGKDAAARDRFIDAVIAEPYSRYAWFGLVKLLKQKNLSMKIVRLSDRARVTQVDGKGIAIGISDHFPKDDPNYTAWLSYGLTRAAWRGEKFKTEFPNEKSYRHTLKEEADSLSTMIKVLQEHKDFANLKPKLETALQDLIKLYDAGYLEPFIMLHRADADIAQDYATFRDSNREKIRRYLDESVVPQLPAAKAK